MAPEDKTTSENWPSLFSPSQEVLLQSPKAVLQEELTWDMLTVTSYTTELASPSLQLEESRMSWLSVDGQSKQEQLVWDLAVPMAPAFYEPSEAGLHGPDDLDARLHEKCDNISAMPH